MSNELVPVDVSEHIRRDVYKEARAGFPGECCGWLSGPKGEWTATAVHPAVNVQDKGTHPTHPGRGTESAYVFSPDDLLALDNSLDSDEPARVIYHSHPNGRAYMSEIDREVATSPWGDEPAFPVQQLVVGVDEHGVAESALYAWSDEQGEFVEIARFTGEI